VCAAVTAGGFVAGAAFGPPDFRAFAAPLNLALLALLALPCLLRALFPANPALRFLGGPSFAAAVITFFVAFALWMGLVPQLPPGALAREAAEGAGGLPARLGLFGLTSSAPFAALYLALMASLAASTAAGLRRPVRPVFVLNHLGLFLVLAAQGLGAADRESHFMTVFEGRVEWRADAGTEGAEREDLPVALRLDDFDLEEYPADLLLVGRETGKPLPEGRPAFYSPGAAAGSPGLPGWDLEILEYLPRAAPAGGGSFARAVMKASAQAVLVRARRAGGGGESFTGWLSPGNAMTPPAFLALGEGPLLVMAAPLPRRFVSRVKAFTREGVEVEGAVEVNSPLTAGPWHVYQHGYDDGLGRLSPWSRFLLVKDRWRPLGRAGFVLWLLGSAGLALSVRRTASVREAGGAAPAGPSPAGSGREGA
jgi:hypothetical protein